MKRKWKAGLSLSQKEKPEEYEVEKLTLQAQKVSKWKTSHKKHCAFIFNITKEDNWMDVLPWTFLTTLWDPPSYRRCLPVTWYTDSPWFQAMPDMRTVHLTPGHHHAGVKHDQPDTWPQRSLLCWPIMFVCTVSCDLCGKYEIRAPGSDITCKMRWTVF